MQIDNLLLNVLGHFEVSVVFCLLRFVGKEDQRGLYSSPGLNEMGPGQQPTREDQDSGRRLAFAAQPTMLSRERLQHVVFSPSPGKVNLASTGEHSFCLWTSVRRGGAWMVKAELSDEK